MITNYSPEIVFIYEGDNDIAYGKNPREVFKDVITLVEKLKYDLPDTKVVFISAKPSIARWNLKKQYNRLNKKISKLCEKSDGFKFADTWGIMLDENGSVYQEISMGRACFRIS